MSGDEGMDNIVRRLQGAVRDVAPRRPKGRVRSLLGVIVHATVPHVRLGELCHLVDPSSHRRVLAEVVGLADDMAILTPIGDLAGLSSLTEVVPTGDELRVPVGEGLLGRVISAVGEPLDDGPWPPRNMAGSRAVAGSPPEPLSRGLIEEPIQLGIRAIDGLLTVGRGQRIGIFGEPGIGKSSLLAEIARNTDADVVVIGLIGERGREVREFIDRQLGPQGRAKSVVVTATSDRPAMERVKAAHVATAIAEYFRDTGRSVLLLMDSVTRYARAMREIGLAAGEPPTRRGFPPSLFATLPRLLERSGPAPSGSITGIYTVLVEGDGMLDPVAEEVQAILDGHIILSPDLAQRNHFPAIDVLRSRSRLMEAVAPADHRRYAARIRELMSRYQEVELLVRVGEYERGSDKTTDEAVAKIDRINAFLRQPAGHPSSLAEIASQMKGLAE
ncbi:MULTISPECIES: FliI/YscN family ATPase [Rhodomicrobium]|uniref:FliI/YscN family ATPase n=1 Tax=Rhodomicrobium TaxID=1068 RepID=UPI000B4B244C|nr:MULTISPECIES: FliI/YscN family ATPase [Rhodomicrobium]